MNTLIVNKTEQTATEQLFYFPGIPPPRHLRRINNRLVVENHKTLMGSALWTICKTEVRRRWPGTWFCHALPGHPPPQARQSQVAQLAHRELWGWARCVLQLSREGSGGAGESHVSSASAPQAKCQGQQAASEKRQSCSRLSLPAPSPTPQPRKTQTLE